MDTPVLQKIIFRSTEGCCCIIPQFLFKSLGKNLCHRIVTMGNKYMFWSRLKGFRPFYKSVYISMATDSRHFADFSSYLYSLTKQLQLHSTFQQCPSRSSDSLVSNKKNGISGIPQIVFQMMFDTTCITHTTGGNDHLAVLIKVDSSGIIGRNGGLQSLEG